MEMNASIIPLLRRQSKYILRYAHFRTDVGMVMPVISAVSAVAGIRRTGLHVPPSFDKPRSASQIQRFE